MYLHGTVEAKNNDNEDKIHLSTLLPSNIIEELDLNLNSLSGYQAEKFILGLIEGGINKRMIKSKIKNKIKGKVNLINYFNNLLK